MKSFPHLSLIVLCMTLISCSSNRPVYELAYQPLEGIEHNDGVFQEVESYCADQSLRAAEEAYRNQLDQLSQNVKEGPGLTAEVLRDRARNQALNIAQRTREEEQEACMLERGFEAIRVCVSNCQAEENLAEAESTL